MLDHTPRGVHHGQTIATDVETPEHLKDYSKLTDDEFARILKAYRKAYGKIQNGSRDLTYYVAPSPESQTGPQPHRQKNRASYVQRFKILRDRNKNLPKLDFNAKATGAPKKFQDTTSFSRSYTYDSIKLPSISTCSVVTGLSGKSVHSDGYRRQDNKSNKTSIQDQMSDSMTDLSHNKDFHDLSIALSKSLQNLPTERLQPNPPAAQTDRAGRSRQKYERISYQKHLSTRNSKVAAGSNATAVGTSSVASTNPSSELAITSDTNTLTQTDVAHTSQRPTNDNPP